MALKIDVYQLREVGGDVKSVRAGAIYVLGDQVILDPPGEQALLLAAAWPVWFADRRKVPVGWLRGLVDAISLSSRYSTSEVEEVPDEAVPWDFSRGRLPDAKPGQGRFVLRPSPPRSEG
jgi:hypothetical protein